MAALSSYLLKHFSTSQLNPEKDSDETWQQETSSISSIKFVFVLSM